MMCNFAVFRSKYFVFLHSSICTHVLPAVKSC